MSAILTAIVNFITAVSTIIHSVTHKAVVDTILIGALKSSIKLAGWMDGHLVVFIQNTTDTI